MTPTFFGAIVVLAGLILMTRTASIMLAFVLLCTLFGAASVISLTALGGSSVQPAYLALAFLLARIFLSPLGRISNISFAIKKNLFLVIFCVYGAFSAFVLPRLFAGALDVVPMLPRTARLYDLYPLGFSAQNITTAVYLLGTMALALATTLIVRRGVRDGLIVTSALAIAWLHVGFGIVNLLLAGIGHADWLDIFRNGNYAQLSQDFGGIVRISGTFPETSIYSIYGFVWLVFLMELWLRNVRPLATGAAAVAMTLTLLLTTSSSAYLGLAGYAGVLLVRFCLTPARLPFSKSLWLGMAFLGACVAVLGIAAFDPVLFKNLWTTLLKMTIEKGNTESGVQREVWARQGLDAFRVSYGLGVGAGSFRSSSIVSAIAGSMGVVGLTAFVAYLFAVLRPLHARSHLLALDPISAIGSAAAWTAILGLIPALVTAPSPDPGLLFGYFSGIALALMTPRPNALSSVTRPGAEGEARKLIEARIA